jgi:hypothetical protein
MHLPINVKSPTIISEWNMGFNSAFNGLTDISSQCKTPWVSGNVFDMRLKQCSLYHDFRRRRFVPVATALQYRSHKTKLPVFEPHRNSVGNPLTSREAISFFPKIKLHKVIQTKTGRLPCLRKREDTLICFGIRLKVVIRTERRGWLSSGVCVCVWVHHNKAVPHTPTLTEDSPCFSSVVRQMPG